MTSRERKRTLFTSATIAAAAFNLPVMVIAGLFIGVLLSMNQESPLRELFLIGIPILFFGIAVECRMGDVEADIDARPLAKVPYIICIHEIIPLPLTTKIPGVWRQIFQE